MTMNSHVLVIIPTFNRAHFLPDAISSVLDQDYPHKKILIIDDGSSDDTKALCEDYIEQYGEIISYQYQQNSGVSSARNRGLNGIGEEITHVCFLDSDDRLLPGKFSREIALLDKQPDADFTYSDAVVYDELSGIEECQAVAGAGRPDTFVLQHFLTNASKPAAILYRANILKNQRFREDLHYSEDVEFLQRIASEHKGIYCAEPGCWVRWHQHSQSRNLIEILKAVLQLKLDVIREKPDFYLANKSAIDQLIQKTRKLLAAQLLLARRWDEVPVYTGNLFSRAQAKLKFSGYQRLRLQLNLWLNKRHLKHH